MAFAKLIGMAAALAVLFGAAAQAQTVRSGFVDASIGRSDIEVGNVEDDATVYGLGGSYAGPINDRAFYQFDVRFNDVDSTDGESLEGQAHIGVRNETGAGGAFVYLADEDNDSAAGVGVEGDLYRGSWTFGGQVAYIDGEDDASSLGAAADASYFVARNLRVGGYVAIADVEVGGFDDTGYGIGADAEYQFRQSPISVFAQVSHETLDDSNIDATSFRVGGRVNFGTGDLFDRDRKGASFVGLLRGDLA